jgi:hypothetical protein
MSSTRTVRIVLIALALLGIGWAVAPRSAPPLYDGVGFPDEPYRFVVAPQGIAVTKAPTTATGSTTVTNGRSGALRAASAEQAPQISLLIPVDRLQAPGGTARIVLHATPVASVTPPSRRYLWSNVYDVAATRPGTTLRDASPPATITLRAATAQRPYATIERYTGQRWTALKTVAVGNDIYQATLPSLGRYAVIGTNPLDTSLLKGGSAKTSTNMTGIIVSVAAIVVIIVLVVIGVRRRSERRREDDLTGEIE